MSKNRPPESFFDSLDFPDDGEFEEQDVQDVLANLRKDLNDVLRMAQRNCVDEGFIEFIETFLMVVNQYELTFFMVQQQQHTIDQLNRQIQRLQNN